MASDQMAELAEQTFDDLVAGAAPNPENRALYDRLAGGVTVNYLILFTARSGSSWLTQALTRKLGTPEEYINPAFVRQVAEVVGANDRRSFIRGVQGRTHTSGVFGIEATSEHIARFGEEQFFSLLTPNIVVFHLHRWNLVQQAISLFRATETGHYHSPQGVTPDNPPYDGDKIRHWLNYIATQGPQRQGFPMIEELVFIGYLRHRFA
jgi:LPS sulfotransferase NodH